MKRDFEEYVVLARFVVLIVIMAVLAIMEKWPN